MASLITTQGVMCRICLSFVYDRQECACGNCAIIIDEDGHQHLYVNEITTTQRAILYHEGDFKEIRRELLNPFGEAIYAPYHFYDKPFMRKDRAPKRYEPRRTSTEYDEALIAALDRDILKTSDGKEDFQRNAILNPKKKY